MLNLYEDGGFRLVGTHNVPQAYAEYWKRDPVYKFGPHLALGRMAATKQLVHILDYTKEDSYKKRDPAAVSLAELAGVRTLLVIPMLKENKLIGAIRIYRQQVRPFTGEADQTGRKLRGSSRHCHRERAAAERITPAHR